MAYVAKVRACRDCGVEQFLKYARCRECQSAYDHARRTTPEARERLAARMARYRARRPDVVKASSRRTYERHREKIKEKNAAYKAANAERYRELDALRWQRDKQDPERLAKRRDSSARWYAANTERMREVRRQWRRANPRKMAEYAARHRSLKANGRSVGVTERDWLRLCRRYGFRCAYCLVAEATEMEHVIPVSRGGLHSIGNVLPACRGCNASKHTKLLIEWRRDGARR